jgi:hypothetical protein
VRLLAWAGVGAIAAVLLVQRGRDRWLEACVSNVAPMGVNDLAAFLPACGQTADNMGWFEAIRIGLGGAP